MAFESFKRSNKKEEEISGIVDASTHDADPTTYSMLPPEKMRTKILRTPDQMSLPVRTAEGETYYEMDSNKGNRQEGQQAIERMLKGVLNVSDIVSLPDAEGKEKFYSLETPLKKIEQNTTKEQVAAEQMLLGYIFNSQDHSFNLMSGAGNNVRFEKGKAVHFDFGDDAASFLKKPDREPLIAQLEQQDPETLAYLGDKATELRDRFEGEEGKLFLKAIIDASHTPVTELFGPKETFDAYKDIEPFDLVYRTLVGRIEGLSKLLNEISVDHSPDSKGTDLSELLRVQTEQDKEEAAQLLKKMTGE